MTLMYLYMQLRDHCRIHFSLLTCVSLADGFDDLLLLLAGGAGVFLAPVPLGVFGGPLASQGGRFGSLHVNLHQEQDDTRRM